MFALGAAAAAWFLFELVYRIAHGIPLIGGTLYQDQLRMPDRELAEHPKYKDFLARFRPSDHPILFYEPRPDYRGTFSPDPESGRAAEIAINSQGFRDREYPLEKDAGTFRIAVLGDSIVWGHGLPVEDSFPEQLERLCAEQVDRRVEVLNFGVSGYSTRQEVELYRVKVSRYDPDLVVVGYCLNDYLESSVESRAFHRLYYDLFSHSYALDLVQRAVAGLAGGRLDSHRDEELQSVLRGQFELLSTLCGDARIVVVIFPELTDFRVYVRKRLHERIVEALNGTTCEVLDLLEPFSRHEFQALQLNPRDNAHPNALGNRIAAEAALAFLRAKHLLPLDTERSPR